MEQVDEMALQECFSAAHMKLLWITRGPNTHHSTLIEALRNHGIDVEACYFHGKYKSDRLNLGWKDPVLNKWEHYAKTLKEIKAAVPDCRERIALVPGFSQWVEWRTMILAILRREKFFVMSEGSRGRWFMRPLVSVFAKAADKFALAVFALGPFAYKQFISAGVRRGKLVKFCYATLSLKKEHIISKKDASCCTFVFAGEFCYRKGFDVLLVAWKRLHEELVKTRLIVIGGCSNASLRIGVETVEDYLAYEGVEYLGKLPQEEVYSIMRRGDVIVLPSRYDPWGAALVEGANAGLAMIGSDMTGSAVELINEGVNGFLARAGDAESLYSRMKLYAANPALAREHGINAQGAARATDGNCLASEMIDALSGK